MFKGQKSKNQSRGNFFQDIWSIICKLLGINSGGDPSNPDSPSKPTPTTPAQMKGWGPTYCWMNTSEDDIKTLAEAMSNKGVNLAPLELFGFEQDKWIDNIQGLMDLLYKRIKIFNNYGILVDLKLVNWNMGGGNAPMKTTPCDSRLNDVWFQSLLTALLPYQDKVLIQACCEWGPSGRHKECWKKAEHWCGIEKEQWKGMKSWNAGSRPGSAPAGYILDWHVDRFESLGPTTSNKIVTTDTSGILNWLGGLNGHLGNHERLAQLVKACKAQKCGFSGYTFFNAVNMEQDIAAINVIGDA